MTANQESIAPKEITEHVEQLRDWVKENKTDEVEVFFASSSRDNNLKAQLPQILEQIHAHEFKSLEMLWVFVKHGYNIGQTYQAGYKKDEAKTLYYQNLDYKNNPNFMRDIENAALSIEPYLYTENQNLPLQATLSAEHFAATRALLHLGAPIHRLNTKISMGAYQILWIKATATPNIKFETKEEEKNYLDARIKEYLVLFDIFKSKGQSLEEKIHIYDPPLFELMTNKSFSLKLAQYFLDNGANPHERVERVSFNDGHDCYETALTLAIRKNHQEFIEEVFLRLKHLEPQRRKEQISQIKKDIAQSYQVSEKKSVAAFELYQALISKAELEDIVEKVDNSVSQNAMFLTDKKRLHIPKQVRIRKI